MLTLAMFLAAINALTIFWVVLAASVIGLLAEGWPKPWKMVAAVVLLVIAVLVVIGSA